MRDYSFDEDDALDRIDEIGSAFDNDYNDGDNVVAYEGLHTARDHTGQLFLYYCTQLEDDTKLTFKWKLTFGGVYED